MVWLTGYKYRREIPVAATTAAVELEDYVVALRIIKSTGQSAPGVVTLDDDALNWPYDIAFTDQGGNLLSHYREEYDTTDGTWYVKLTVIPSTGTTKFYIYYGCLDATDYSSGLDTFILFDDFESGDLSYWDTAESQWSAQSSIKYEGSYAAKSVGSDTNRALKKSISTSTSVILHSRVRKDSSDANAYFYPFCPAAPGHDHIYAVIMSTGYFRYYVGGLQVSFVPYILGQWHNVDVGIDLENLVFRWWIDGRAYLPRTLKDGSGNALASTDYISEFISYASPSVYPSPEMIGYMDQVWVRPYIYPEPALATPGISISYEYYLHGEESPEEEHPHPPIPIYEVPWLNLCKYVVAIPVAATTAAVELEDYVMKITIKKGVGVSTPGIIYLNNLALSWPYDIVFTDQDGNVLPCYREEYDTTDGTWHVKLNTIAASGFTNFFIHYGYHDATDPSSGLNTFILFDDFESGDLSYWDTAQSGWSVQSSIKHSGSYAAKALYVTAENQRTLSKNIAPSGSVVMHTRFFTEYPTGPTGGFYDIFLPAAGEHSINALRADGSYYYRRGATGWHDGGYYPSGINSRLSAHFIWSTWYELECAIDYENLKFRWWFDTSLVNEKDLVDGDGVALTASDLLDKFSSVAPVKSYQYDEGNFYLDQVWIRPYIYPEPTWGEPLNFPLDRGMAPAVPDGIYLVSRSIDSTLQPAKTIRNYAYNDSYFEFLPNAKQSSYYSPGINYLQNDRNQGIIAHYWDSTYKCKFNNVVVADAGKTVLDVTVSAFISGMGRTIFERGGVNYYGELTTRGHVAGWVDTVYTVDPATSQAWTITNLGYYPIAGVDIRAPPTAYTDPYPRTLNTEYTPHSLEFPGDPEIYLLGSICYTVKITVRYTDVNRPGEILSYELFPYDSIVGGGTNVAAYVGNKINNGVPYAREKWMLAAMYYADLPNPYWIEYQWASNVRDLIGTVGTASSLKVKANADSWEFCNWHCKVYLKINGTKYYHASEKTDSFDLTYFEWATNPATSAAWAEGDLAEGDGFGLEFHDDGNAGEHRLVCRFFGELWVDGVCHAYSYRITRDGLIVCDAPVTCSLETWFNSIYPGWYGMNTGNARMLIGEPLRASMFCATPDTSLVKRYASDLATIPPSFSSITGFKVFASVYAWADNSTASACHWHIFIEVAGTRYYSDAYTLAGSPNLLVSQNYTWNTNPATSAAWTFDEIQGIRFGLEVSRATDEDLVVFRPYALYSDLTYREIFGPNQPAYLRIQAIDSSMSLIKNSQTPKLKADELAFTMPQGGYIPERAEIVMFRDGNMPFHGFVWTADQRPNLETKILAKSQQHALACRYIPSFFYHARNTRFMSVYDMADLFSDAVPIYPNESYFIQYTAPDYTYEWWLDMWNNFGPSDSILIERDPVVWMLGSTYSNLGLFFILNSLMPYGYNGETQYYRNWAGYALNRAKFLYSHNPSVIPTNDAENNLMDGYRSMWGITVLDEVGDYWPDEVGAVRRFRKGASDSLGGDEYAYSGNDLKVGHYPGAFQVLFDHAMETYIRPGSFELANKYLAVPYIFDGSFEAAFSDFFFRLGQEVRFRNALDGYVYMDTGSDLGRETNLKFRDGKNATVTKSTRDDPMPGAVLGNLDQPRISTDWLPARTWLTKVELTQRTGEDLQEWLDLRRIEDKSTWTIKTQQKLWHLMTGDHIEAQAHGYGLEECHVRKMVVSNAGTTITAGKRLVDLADEWGMWLGVRGSLDAAWLEVYDNSIIPIQSVSDTATGTTFSDTFVVKAEEYVIGSWKCKLEISWELWVQDDYTADLPSAPLGMFLIAQVNSKVIPPGRIRAKGNQGSVELDITDACTGSTSSDSTNTLSIKLWRGISPGANYGHKVAGTVTQYRRFEAVSNA